MKTACQLVEAGGGGGGGGGSLGSEEPPQTKKGPLECMKRSTRFLYKNVHYYNLLALVNIDLDTINRGSKQVVIQSAGACHVLKSYTGRSTFFTQRTYLPNCLAIQGPI